MLALPDETEKNAKTFAGEFDHCKVTNARLFLNAMYYQNYNMKQGITRGRFAVLYNMYARFQILYYNQIFCQSRPDVEQFKSKALMFVFDCSRQNESLKAAAANTIRIRSGENFFRADNRLLHDNTQLTRRVHNSVQQDTHTGINRLYFLKKQKYLKVIHC